MALTNGKNTKSISIKIKGIVVQELNGIEYAFAIPI